MPEGDTIFRTATSLRRWLAGRQITSVRAPRVGFDTERLVGRTVETVEARGKHLLVRLDGGQVGGPLALHTHMGMTGSWHVYPAGERWRKPSRQATIMLGAGNRVAVCFNAPVVELLSRVDEAAHPSLARLGPDVLVPEVLDPVEVRRRGRARAPASVTIGELLLDQQVVSGIGNIYRCESLFLCGVHPATPVGEVDGGQLDRLVETASSLMRANLGAGAGAGADTGPGAGARAGVGGAGRRGPPWVYGRQGRPCRRCGTLIRRQLLGVQPRPVYWCPGCQPDRAGARPDFD
ncbi:MAG TPA: DNA-formamidopyrimidine glycosylase family protein [Acidimicrobiales bacterium]|nr:DNA-formamidopyrimidine glycosylase family protein [Acidimicrobiales bacterium]